MLLLLLRVAIPPVAAAAAALVALVAAPLLGHRRELRGEGRPHSVRPGLQRRGLLLLLLLLRLPTPHGSSNSGGRRGHRRQRLHRPPQRRQHAARLRRREQEVGRRAAHPGQRLHARPRPLLAAHLGPDRLEVGVFEQSPGPGPRGARGDADGDELGELARGHAGEARRPDAEGDLPVDLGGVAALGVGVLERGELLLLLLDE